MSDFEIIENILNGCKSIITTSNLFHKYPEGLARDRYVPEVRWAIMGINGNSDENDILPTTGMEYSDVKIDNKQLYSGNQIHGETGAQSSFMPLILSIAGGFEFKESNPLRQLLTNFSGQNINHPMIYRPLPHQNAIDEGRKIFNNVIRPRLHNKDVSNAVGNLINKASEFRLKHYAAV